MLGDKCVQKKKKKGKKEQINKLECASGGNRGSLKLDGQSKCY